MAIGILIGGTLALIFLGIPIAIALALATMIELVRMDLPLSSIVQQAAYTLNSYPLLAIPFFILAGEIMNSSGITRRIIDCALSWVGHIRGGLAHTSVMANVFMAGTSGSAVADSSVLGTVLYPEMVKNNFPPRFSAGLLASAGAIGPIIPPSIPMVLFGLTAQVSISGLFLGGVIPGLLMAVVMMIYSYFIGGKVKAITRVQFSLRRALTTTGAALPALFMPIIILVGILGGFFTPTEAATVAVGYGILVGAVIYRELSWKKLFHAAKTAGYRTAVVGIIISFSGILAHQMALEQIPSLLTDSLLAFSNSNWVLLLILNGILLVVGFFLDSSPAILILTPILMPVIDQAGIDPVQFGVVMVLNLMIGLLTPPVGALLYVGSEVTGLSLENMVRAVIPFILLLLVVLMMITFIPALTTGLPQLFH